MTDQSIHQDEEIWKPVVGYESSYLVSNYGEIYSLISNKKLKQRLSNKGYYIVGLGYGGKRKKMVTIHRVVYSSFKGKINGDINHIDGDRKNNNISNLEDVNRRENVTHGYRANKKKTGAFFCKRDKIWSSAVYINGERIFLGRFDTEDIAHNAYLNALYLYDQSNKYSSK